MSSAHYNSYCYLQESFNKLFLIKRSDLITVYMYNNEYTLNTADHYIDKLNFVGPYLSNLCVLSNIECTKESLPHGRRIKKKDKEKVVAAVWGTDLIQFLAVLAILHQDD